jgi:hypothetical protein
MASSQAATVAAYLAELPADRRAIVSAVRTVVNKHLPKGYVEVMSWGMITWEVPLRVAPDTYNGQPLGYAALAARKGSYSLYLMGAYAFPDVLKALQDGFASAGKRLDMGKSCVRFKTLEALPLDVIGKAIASVPLKTFVAATAQGARAKASAATSRRAAPSATRSSPRRRS